MMMMMRRAKMERMRREKRKRADLGRWVGHLLMRKGDQLASKIIE
jgi:hypothetical protein